MEWDIEEVKRLKKKQLVQSNLMIMLLFVLLVYSVSVGVSLSIILGLFCLFLWISVAYSFYNLATGKIIGTKTSRLIQAFDKERWGERGWKRRKGIGAIFISIISAICTVLVLKMDLSSDNMGFINLFPFIGAWLGSNIGGTIRINNLQRNS